MGWLMAFVLLAAIILVHEAGHFLAARAVGVKVNAFSLGFGADTRLKVFGKEIRLGTSFKFGETEYRLGAIPLGGYIEQDEESFNRASLLRRTVVILAGVKANFLLAVALMWSIFFTGYPAMAPVVGAVFDGSPAEQAGLEGGDTVIMLDGHAVRAWDEIAKILVAGGGKTVEVIVRRDGVETRSFVTPQRTEAKNAIGLPEERFTIGIAPTGEFVTVALPFFEAVERAVSFNYDMLKLNAQGILAIFTGELAAKDNLAGPVGIVSVSNQAYQAGWTTYVMLAALISAVVGMMNLLPLPVLDGGQFVFLACEGVFGLTPSENVRAALNTLSLAALLALMLYATWFDVVRIVG
ncbi:MAG: site-2 protease family protein [Candidatus Niyogibacteria bacterium]|nr:site-2 protease family protein [Candidatus Niyogibacteria bacterium]